MQSARNMSPKIIWTILLLSIYLNVYGDTLHRIETPAITTRDSVVIEHTGYMLSFDMKSNNPRWVAWELTKEEVNSNDVSRSNDFRGDLLIPAPHRVEGYDYKQTGYDRGHMCPAADMKWNPNAMSECFYMSNMCPQASVLNQTWWEHLESACRRWANKWGSIYICCGPIYDDEVPARFIGERVKIRIPDAFFKVVVLNIEGEEKGIGFIYANTADRQPMGDVIHSIDEVEQITGIDFFANLPDEIEEKVEKMDKLKGWN